VQRHRAVAGGVAGDVLFGRVAGRGPQPRLEALRQHGPGGRPALLVRIQCLAAAKGGGRVVQEQGVADQQPAAGGFQPVDGVVRVDIRLRQQFERGRRQAGQVGRPAVPAVDLAGCEQGDQPCRPFAVRLAAVGRLDAGEGIEVGIGVAQRGQHHRAARRRLQFGQQRLEAARQRPRNDEATSRPCQRPVFGTIRLQNGAETLGLVFGCGWCHCSGGGRISNP